MSNINFMKQITNKYNSTNKIFESDNIIYSDYNDYLMEEFEDYCELGKNHKLIESDKVTIVINFPLESPVKIKIQNKGGWTRKKLFSKIKELYQNIYKEEEEFKLNESNSNIINLNSNGKYGIWGGYNINELALESIQYDKSTEEITLGVGVDK